MSGPPPENHWLENVEELAASLRHDGPGQPDALTFLLGAGASISSGAPRTSEILAACRKQRPGVFTDDDKVYEEFTKTLPPRERDAILSPLFKGLEPYIGYRCLAAMARSRPIFVVNLNWDPCIGYAGKRVGVPVRSFDLSDVSKGTRFIAETLEQGHGVVCVHVHGHLADAYQNDADAQQAGEVPAKHGIRFDRPATHSFQPDELALLCELLAHRTVICGTSLIGPRDVNELIQALIPRLESTEQRDAVAALWVFQRGPTASAPGVDSYAAEGLSTALHTRHSNRNFVSSPDVDFDTLLTVLRSVELDFPWSKVVKAVQSRMRLPPLAELIPPNPRVVRPLLDKQRLLLIGAPHVGISTLAYRLAWWRGLTVDEPPNARLSPHTVHGPQQALDYLQGAGSTTAGSIVIDRLFDESDAGDHRNGPLFAELGIAIEKLERRQVIAMASPDAVLTVACQAGAPAHSKLENIVVGAHQLWSPRDLRAWARARGGERAEMVCRQIRLGLIRTPSQAVRTLAKLTTHEEEPAWAKRLRGHLDKVYGRCDDPALLLALLRLQDFSVPRCEASLALIVGAQATYELASDPWGLCEQIKVDRESYLRLNHPAVILTVDSWLADGLDAVRSRLQSAGAPARWALDALERWEVFNDSADSSKMPAKLSHYELELFGSEYVRRSLQEKHVESAMGSLWQIWETAQDQWAAKDVAHDLVLNWEALGADALARKLRDELLMAEKELGAYALFEAILRIGQPVPLELWTAVVSRLLDLAAESSPSAEMRHQIALSLDALMWRRSPVNSGQEHKLLRSLLDAVRRDELLRAAVATAAGYHFKGAERLKKAGFDLPALVDTDVPLQQAREMAWMVEWHFAHQSRCRAIASRRTFLSTSPLTASEVGPRYLDRSLSENEFDPEHERSISRLAEALLGHAETADWALHLIMNIHCTAGQFHIADETIAHLNATIGSTQPGPGVISAAMTYMPTGQIVELLSRVLDTSAGNDALQMGLGAGIRIGDAQVVEPRFSTSSDPWAIRDRWHATPRRLPFGIGVPTELIESLRERLDEAVKEEAVDRESAIRALEIMRRGDTRAVEVWPQRDFAGSFVELLAFVTDYYAGK